MDRSNRFWVMLLAALLAFLSMVTAGAVRAADAADQHSPRGVWSS